MENFFDSRELKKSIDWERLIKQDLKQGSLREIEASNMKIALVEGQDSRYKIVVATINKEATKFKLAQWVTDQHGNLGVITDIALIWSEVSGVGPDRDAWYADQERPASTKNQPWYTLLVEPAGSVLVAEEHLKPAQKPEVIENPYYEEYFSKEASLNKEAPCSKERKKQIEMFKHMDEQKKKKKISSTETSFDLEADLNVDYLPETEEFIDIDSGKPETFEQVADKAVEKCLVKEATPSVTCKNCGRGAYEGVNDEGEDDIFCSKCNLREDNCICTPWI